MNFTQLTTKIARIQMNKVQLAKYITRNTLIRSMAALSILGMAWMTASAQLTLDNFPTGNSGKNYVKSLTTAQSSVTHQEALPKGSLLGAARQTVFGIGGNPYALSSTLSVGNGILFVDSGFQIDSGLNIYYGVNLSGDPVPLGLDLSAYSALQLNFAGIASTESLYVIVEVWPSSGGYYNSELVLNPSQNPYSAVFPYTSFTGAGGTLTQAEASDINYIVIVTEAGGSTNSWGITSFQAVD